MRDWSPWWSTRMRTRGTRFQQTLAKDHRGLFPQVWKPLSDSPVMAAVDFRFSDSTVPSHGNRRSRVHVIFPPGGTWHGNLASFPPQRPPIFYALESTFPAAVLKWKEGT